MKRCFRMLCILLSCCLLLGSTGGFITLAQAENERLITVGGKTVTDSMTLSDIMALFGEPKLTTGSLFGGNACTFYGEGYQDYLYIETFADGSIACYGSISEGFQTNTLSYGDTPDNHVRFGYEATDRDGKLFGIIRYRHYQRGLLSDYYADAATRNRELCQHAVEMWNAVSYLYGYNTPTVFDEKTFYTNQQLADNGSDLYNYCSATSQSSYFRLCGLSTAAFIDDYYYPNPLLFAEKARSYTCTTDFTAAFLFRQNANGSSVYLTGFLNPRFFDERHTVPYTAEEQATLKEMRALYAQSVATFNEGTSEGYYTVTPQYEELPLTAGLLNEKVARGAVDFLNVIRIGGGLEPLTYSAELSEAAMCKATLTVYMSANNISNPNPHFPEKPDGVDDELYAKSLLGNSENLYMCGILSENIIGSLVYALDDSYGTGQYYARGHRYNLLDPYWTTIGLGNTGVQGVHKMTGYRSSNVDVVAWPSKGVTPQESGISGSTMFTCQFYNGLHANDSTVVTVKCLNTGNIWRIAKDTLTADQDFCAADTLISYRDTSIALAVGNVYEITFDGLTDADGNTVSYSYRSVYENAYIEDSETEPQTLTLSSTQLCLTPNATEKVSATLTPFAVKNAMVTWQSDAPEIASVNENGFITAHGVGTATVSARTDNGLIETIRVTVSQVLKGDLNDDGKANMLDAMMLYRYTNGSIELSEQQIAQSDLNDDGRVNMADTMQLYLLVSA